MGLQQLRPLAETACKEGGQAVFDHIARMGEMIEAGKGAQRDYSTD
jgi:hypothetical protein